MNAPLVTVNRADVNDKNVKISWAAPYDNGAEITKYQIEVKDKNGNYVIVKTVNTGETDFTNRYIVIAMADL